MSHVDAATTENIKYADDNRSRNCVRGSGL